MGDSYIRPQSPWQGLGRCHLAGLRLGGSGGGLIVTQDVLAAAECGEHAVPELEGKGHESGAGSTQSVCSKLARLVRFASSPLSHQPSATTRISNMALWRELTKHVRLHPRDARDQTQGGFVTNDIP